MSTGCARHARASALRSSVASSGASLACRCVWQRRLSHSVQQLIGTVRQVNGGQMHSTPRSRHGRDGRWVRSWGEYHLDGERDVHCNFRLVQTEMAVESSRQAKEAPSRALRDGELCVFTGSCFTRSYKTKNKEPEAEVLWRGPRRGLSGASSRLPGVPDHQADKGMPSLFTNSTQRATCNEGTYLTDGTCKADKEKCTKRVGNFGNGRANVPLSWAESDVSSSRGSSRS